MNKIIYFIYLFTRFIHVRNNVGDISFFDPIFTVFHIHLCNLFAITLLVFTCQETLFIPHTPAFKIPM